MYAVIKTGGKQYRVSKGATLKVEKIDADEGATIKFDQVLMLSDGKNVSIGTPLLDGSQVTAKVLSQGKGRKIEVIKFKRRKNYKRNVGHRQLYTEVEITGITAGKAKAAKSTKATEKPATEEPAAKEAAATRPVAKKAASKATSKKTTTKKATVKKAPAKKAASKKSAE